MTSFKCNQCKVCQRRKTISEEFTNSNTCCDDCFIPPEPKQIKERQSPKRDTRLWTMYNRKNPKAKQLYKQSLISNS